MRVTEVYLACSKLGGHKGQRKHRALQIQVCIGGFEATKIEQAPIKVKYTLGLLLYPKPAAKSAHQTKNQKQESFCPRDRYSRCS